MSWSVSVIGKPAKVADELKLKFANMAHLAKPEDEIAAAIGRALIQAAADTTDTRAVIKVEASGSMVSNGGLRTHAINVTVTPLYGFLE